VPVDPKSGRNASTNNPATWGTHEQAVARAQRSGLPGVGFVLTEGDSLTGADLDDVRDPETGAMEPWAAEIVSLGETYCEISPSGRGLRFFWDGKIDQALVHKPAQIEVYGRGRYLTVTGDHVRGTPDSIQPAPKTEAALRARFEQFTVKSKKKVATTISPESIPFTSKTAEEERVRDALRFIRTDDRATWIAVGMALNDEFGNRGLDLFDGWSQTHPEHYDRAGLMRTWRSFGRHSGTTIATVFHLAIDGGWKPPPPPDHEAWSRAGFYLCHSETAEVALCVFRAWCERHGYSNADQIFAVLLNKELRRMGA
jgi:hypothetical protein